MATLDPTFRVPSQLNHKMYLEIIGHQYFIILELCATCALASFSILPSYIEIGSDVGVPFILLENKIQWKSGPVGTSSKCLFNKAQDLEKSLLLEKDEF